MFKKIILIIFVCIINFNYAYSNEDMIFKLFDGYELIYLEKRPYGVYEFYSETLSLYGTYIEKEGKYYYYKFQNKNNGSITNENILEYYKIFLKNNNGQIHHEDENGITFTINNLWVYINVGLKNYDIIAIEIKKAENEFFTYHEIKKELINNGKILLSLIEFENKKIKLDSSNQLVELLKFFSEFDGINLKICYYDFDNKISNKEKALILKEYFEIFGVNTENITIIEKDNTENINGLVLFY